MSKIKEIWRSAPVMSRIAFWICLIASIGLLVAGFVCPPLAEIHPSVLQGVGILFGFATLATGSYALEKGIDAKVVHGNTTLEINNPDNK